MKRYYSVSATNSNFKRRVSWFENIPGQSDISHIKIFEYLGQWPGNSIHGNSKNTAQPYKRTTVPQKQVIEEGVRNGKKPIQIIGNVNKIDPENPIDIKVIRNAKYNFDKKQKPNHSSQQNTADDIQILISQLQSNDFIQSIVANNDNKPPNIICYSEEQMLDLKSCMQNGSIIGIDRTFNLGACYVTCMVYQNPKLLRKGQDVSPVLLGPVFLHWDGSYATYCTFLSKIRASLGFNIDCEKIIFGTDEETALINAIKTTFPNSEHILCVRHLQENAQRNLLKQNVPEKTRNSIVQKLFSKTGLLSAEDRVFYLEREQEILDEFASSCGSYLSEKLLPILKSKVFEPRLKHKQIPLLWKNNNCESMNSKFKILGDWRVSKLPQLVELIREVHDNQLLDIRGALHGRGNFELAESFQHLSIFHSAWLAMTNEQRAKSFVKFVKYQNQCKFQSSGDDLLTIPTTNKIAKKPGQIKRVRTAKTRTIPNKKPKLQGDC